MITYPNSVIVARAATTAGQKGFVDVYNANGVAPTANDTVIYVGVDTGENTTVLGPDGATPLTVNGRFMSSSIDLSRINSITAEKFTAPQQEVATLTLNGTLVTPVPGEELCVSVVYRDIRGRHTNFTQTYRVPVIAGDTAATVATKLAATITKDQNARVTAVADVTTDATNPVITFTGKVVDNNNGLDSINEFSQVNFQLVFFRAAKTQEAVAGVTIAYTQNVNPGFGYWKVVRDREKWALGYKGITNPVHWPVLKPTSFIADSIVAADGGFDQIVISSMNEYQSPDNSYRKETEVVTEIYLPSGTGTAFITKLSALLPETVKSIKAGVATTSDLASVFA